MTAGRPFGRDLTPTGAWTIFAVLVAASLISGIGASFPRNTWLQVGPTILFAAAVPWLARRIPLSETAWAMISGFLLVHLFAAHWTYSNVPYQEWLAAVGIDSVGMLGSDRNMFDRIVHFIFGLLVVRPMIEMEVRWAGLAMRPARRVAILFVLASSALYEIFEWTLAILMSPEAAEAYNGQQGDGFDAQKDMLLAFLGALIALPWANRQLKTVSD